MADACVHVLAFDLGTTAVKAAVLKLPTHYFDDSSTHITIPSSSAAGRTPVDVDGTDAATSLAGISVLASAAVDTAAYLRGDSDFKQQNVAKILEAMEKTCQLLPLDVLHRCRRIAFTDQMHGIVWCKAEEDSVQWYPLVTWEDNRCDSAILARLNTVAAKYALPPLFSGYGMATLAWMREQGALPTDISHIGTIGSVISSLLSSPLLSSPALPSPVLSSPVPSSLALPSPALPAPLPSCCLDPTDGASWGFCDASLRRFHKAALEECLPEMSWLADHDFIRCGAELGVLDRHMCRKIGLHTLANLDADVQVHGCIGDHPAAVFGALHLTRSIGSDSVACASNAILINVGTSAQVTALVPTDCSVTSLPNGCEVRPFVTDAMKLLVGASMNGGNVLSWMVDSFQNVRQLFSEETEVAKIAMYERLEAVAQGMLASDSITFDSMDKPLFRGIYVSPFLLEERIAVLPDKQPREHHGVAVEGLGKLGLLSPAEVYVATCASILHNVCNMLPSECWKSCSRVVATGGAFHHSKTMRIVLQHIIGQRCSATRAPNNIAIEHLAAEHGIAAGAVGAALTALRVGAHSGAGQNMFGVIKR